MAANDPYFASVKLLLHMDGANDGTTFTDVKGHAITRAGNAVTKTGEKKYGAASAYFDGTGDYVYAASSADFSMSTGDFTIEAWVNPTSHTAARTIADTRSAWNDTGMIVYIGTDGKVYAFTAAAERAKSDATITDGAWNHIAVVRSSGTLNVYVGGLGGTGASYASAITCPGVLRFGVDSTGGAGFIGYMDEIRVTPGVARYTADFTPPDAAFGDYDRYLAGAITEATDHTDFVVRAHRLDTGALITELASTGGAYEIPMMISGVGYTGPVMLSAWPRLGSLWAANTAKSLGDYAFPVDPVTTPHVFKCTTAGTTHSTTEPTWDTTPGNTTSDGSVTWTCVDRMLQPLIQGPLIPSI